MPDDRRQDDGVDRDRGEFQDRDRYLELALYIFGLEGQSPPESFHEAAEAGDAGAGLGRVLRNSFPEVTMSSPWTSSAASRVATCDNQ